MTTRRIAFEADGVNRKTGKPISFKVPACASSFGLESIRRNVDVRSITAGGETLTHPAQINALFATAIETVKRREDAPRVWAETMRPIVLGVLREQGYDVTAGKDLAFVTKGGMVVIPVVCLQYKRRNGGSSGSPRLRQIICNPECSPERSPEGHPEGG